MPVTHEDFEYIEHRIYHDYVGAIEYDMNDPNVAPNSLKRNWTPYEQDLSQYPEVFKKYQENYDKYDELKHKFETENIQEEAGEDKFARQLPKDHSPWEKKYEDIMPRYTGTVCQ